MRYTQKSYRKKWIVGGVIILVLITNIFGITDHLKNATSIVTEPILFLSRPIGFTLSGMTQNIKGIFVARREVQVAEEKIRVLEQDVTAVKSLMTENERLRKDLSFPTRADYDMRGADVIAHDMRGAKEWMLISRGKIDGVQVGMPAIVDERTLLGVVEEVFSTSARVRLITNSESTFAAIEPISGAQMVVRGERSLGLLVEDIPRTTEIDEGMLLETIAYNEEFVSKRLLLGKIKEVTFTKDNLLQEALLEPLYDPRRIREVYIIYGVKK